MEKKPWTEGITKHNKSSAKKRKKDDVSSSSSKSSSSKSKRKVDVSPKTSGVEDNLAASSSTDSTDSD